MDPETGEYATVLIPEALSILARYPQGFKATYQFSGLASQVARSEARLSGTKGALYLDLGRQELYFSAGGSDTYDRMEIPAADRGSWRVEADFIDSIREGKPVTLTDFESGVRYMRFSQAVWDSWTDGSKKSVALIPDDTDFAVGFVEFHPALGQGKQGEIPSHTHIFARPVLGASLAHDNVSRNDVFSAVFFDPQHFGIAVAAVL